MTTCLCHGGMHEPSIRCSWPPVSLSSGLTHTVPLSPPPLPWQAHYDSTLGTWPVGVNVLYVDIPEDMEGGELELYSTAVHKYVPGRKPLQRVRPQVGMLCRFRGDMFHKVNSMKRGSRPRISLVLEEYVLADPTRVAMGG